jgi:hypothetical protein
MTIGVYPVKSVSRNSRLATTVGEQVITGLIGENALFFRIWGSDDETRLRICLTEAVRAGFARE